MIKRTINRLSLLKEALQLGLAIMRKRQSIIALLGHYQGGRVNDKLVQNMDDEYLKVVYFANLGDTTLIEMWIGDKVRF